MKKNGPWTIKSTKVAYKSPFIEVREDLVIRPDGKDGLYNVIKIVPGISVVAIDDEQNIYLLNEFKYPQERTSIETVTGRIEEGESRLEAAKRELKEEIGVEADELLELGGTYALTSYMNTPNYLFLARKLHFGERKLDGDESMETLKVSLKDAVEMVLDGRIDNQKTCMCVLKTNEYLRSKGDIIR